MTLNLDQILQIHLAGDLTLAERAYRYLLNQPSPDNLVLINLAAICHNSNRLEEAARLLEEVLIKNPNSPEACNKLGKIYQDLEDYERAVALYRKAILYKKAFVEAHYNLGNTLFILEKFRDSILHYELALFYNPEHYNAHIRLAMVLLLLGAFEKGWSEYERRILPLDPKFPLQLSQKWDGDFSYSGEVILVNESNKGFGDTIQFSSYLPLLQEKGLNISLFVQEPLRETLANLGPDINVYSPECYHDLNLKSNRWFPLMSLPWLFKTDLSSIPVARPLNIPFNYQKKWKNILGESSKKRIAVAWQGNPQHETFDAKGRSFPLEALAEIAKIPNVEFVSVQKFAGSEQLETCSFKDKFIHCQDEISASTDFLDTAAIMQQCDLVISSDTSVAHLAGNLGLRTWLALKKVPEWRWTLEGTTTPWYPSMRLFRQVENNNWQDVFRQMKAQLQQSLMEVK